MITKESNLKNKGHEGTPCIKHEQVINRGSWRIKEPKINYSKCIKCHMCWLYCPDSAITIKKDNYTEPNQKTCKGCGVCAEVCPVKCIVMIRKGVVCKK